MKFNLDWIQEFCAIQLTPEQLAHRLTMAGLEVETIEAAAPPLNDVSVAHVVAVEPHPNADSLRTCRVLAAPGTTMQVVCGAPNVRAGLRVLFARPGARLPDGRVIEKTVIRGIESAGMLCSARELGLGERGDGLLELPTDAELGLPVEAYLGLRDTVFEVALTPNRGDCLSILGLAREISALLAVACRKVADHPVPAQLDLTVPVELAAPHACPRYAARVITGVDASRPTPVWMAERLRRCGVRSINAVVDVTNYVMLERGQPMHAFDFHALQGGIVARFAAADESLTLLDGQTVALNAQTLVIADHQKPVAIAGVMGGQATAVHTASTAILLESAYFDPVTLAGVARNYKVHSDASHRFERGVDYQGQVAAVERATQLILEICGGTPGPTALHESVSNIPKPPAIKFRPGEVEPSLGAAVPTSEILEIFQRLTLAVVVQGETWVVTPPSFRFDLGREVDLIEEIARIRGYEALPSTLPQARLELSVKRSTPGNPEIARRVLVSRAYFEAITYSFIDPDLQALITPEVQPKLLANPIAQDMAAMRCSLWPGLIQAVRYNRNRQQTDLRLFEVGMVFSEAAGKLEQLTMLGGIAVGNVVSEQWGLSPRQVDFFDIKHDVEQILQTLSITGYDFVPGTHSALHPGQSAAIKLGNLVLGFIGLLHPRLAKTFEFADSPVLFELDLGKLPKPALPTFQPLSKFPSVRRDIAVIVADEIPAQRVITLIEDAGKPLLKDLQLFDVYRGQGIDSGKKSLALGLLFKAASSTLVEEEIDKTVARVLDELKRDVGGVLRN